MSERMPLTVVEIRERWEGAGHITSHDDMATYAPADIHFLLSEVARVADEWVAEFRRGEHRRGLLQGSLRDAGLQIDRLGDKLTAAEAEIERLRNELELTRIAEARERSMRITAEGLI